LLLLVIVFITLFYNGCRKVSKAIRTCGQSHDAVLTAELDSYVELIEAVSPSVDDFVSTLYPPVNLPSVHTQVPSLSLICFYLSFRCILAVGAFVLINLSRHSFI